MKQPNFNYANTELYTSRYSSYGYCLFIMVDIENCTFVFGQSNSTCVSLHRAEYRVMERMSQKQVRDLRDRYIQRGYKQLTNKDFL